MKKKLLLVFFIIFALLVGNLFAQGKLARQNKRYALLKPTMSDGKNEMIPLSKEEAKKLLKPNQQPTFFNHITGIIDTLQYVDGRGNPYFGGAPGDSFAVYFSPGAGCKILKVGFNAGYQSNDPNNVPVWGGINVSLNFVNYDGYSEEGGSGKYLLGEWTAANAWIPTEWYGANYSKTPVGSAFWGPFPSSFVPDPVDQGEEVEMSWLGLEADNMGNDFAVVFVPYGNEGDQGAFEDWQTGITRMQRLWKWYTADRKWYLRHGVGFDVWCVVEFYENTPPAVVSGGPWGTVLTNEAKTLDCHVTDIDASNEANAGAASVKMFYKVNDGAFTPVDMTLVSGKNTDGDYEGTLPAGYMNAGDVLTYYFEATDGGGMTAKTDEASFGYFAKTTDILLYYNDPAFDPKAFILNYYLGLVPYNFDVWDGTLDGALSSKLLDMYDYIVEIDGAGPIWLNDDVLGDWFASGGKSMFWSSQEWAGSLWGWSRDSTFADDDWHNQYMGIGHVAHDINYVNDGDEALAFPINAVADDIISGPLAAFTADSLQLYYDSAYELGYSNWIDQIDPGTGAVSCFVDSALGRSVGVHKEYNGSKTVFLGFDQLALDTGPSYYWTEYEVHSLLNATLDWFGITSVKDNFGPGIAKEYDMSQNYPNPFNPETSISYSVAKAGLVKLAVYNVLGQKVADLVNEHKQANTYKVTFDASNLTSGIYFYRLEVGDFTKTMKMMLLQ